jgi:hypothetical protein
MSDKNNRRRFDPPHQTWKEIEAKEPNGREHKDIIERPRGQKRQKTVGGGSRKVTKARNIEPIKWSTQPAIAKLTKGPWRNDNARDVDDKPPVERRPITKAQTKLLVDYMRRNAFRDAIDDGASIEFAGEVHLRVDRRRAYETANEIGSNPLAWFREQFAAGVRNGKMTGGRETAKSSEADLFFCLLAGGRFGFDSVGANLSGGHSTVNLTEAT